MRRTNRFNRIKYVGKSTIINMILGKVSKDSGDIFVNSGYNRIFISVKRFF